MITAELPRVLALSPDQDWIDALVLGEETAYERLVREIGPRVYAVARKLAGNDNDAEEIAAEVFETVFRKISQFEFGSRLTTWIHRITVNAALLRMRSRKSRREMFAGDAGAENPGERAPIEFADHAADSADAVVVDSELRFHLRAAIGKLPERHRTVIELRDIEGRTPEETAITLGITRNAVKIRLHRARRALRSVLEHRFGAQLPDVIADRRRPFAVTPWSRGRGLSPLRATA